MTLRVLHVVPNIDPRQGGPARSVVSLVNALQDAGGLQVTLAAGGDPERADLPLQVRGRWSLLRGESKRRLREADTDAARVTFAPVHVISDPAPMPAAIELVLVSGERLTIPAGVSSAHVRAVLAALRTPC